MFLMYRNDVKCFFTSVKVCVVFDKFNFAMGCLMISWESYLGSSMITFFMKMKCMTLSSATKKSLCVMISMMVLCD